MVYSSIAHGFKFSLISQPNITQKRHYLTSLVRCRPLDQSSMWRGRVPLYQRGRSPINQAYGEEAASEKGAHSSWQASATPITLNRMAQAHSGLETPHSGDLKCLCLPRMDGFLLPFVLPSFKNCPCSSSRGWGASMWQSNTHTHYDLTPWFSIQPCDSVSSNEKSFP